MKKKLGAILLVVVLALALAVPAAPAVAAALTMTVVSDTTTDLISGPGGSIIGPAVYAWEPGPNYPNDGPVDSGWEANSLWDQNLTGHTFSSSADWIWESYRVVNPVAGDVVDFQKTFYIPGVPGPGTLYITCDNGYEVYVNATLVGSAQLGAGWRTSNLTEPFVNSQGWQSVEFYDISAFLQPGLNTIDIYTANEYMGPLDGESNGTQSSNPAGLIFEIDIGYAVPDIEKVLTMWSHYIDEDGIPGPDFNPDGYPLVPMATQITFAMGITVTNNTGVTLTNVLVHDRLGAELELISLEMDGAVYTDLPANPPPGVTVWTRGKSEKWFIDWTIASLAPGAQATLTLVVQTDINPGQGKKAVSVNEYTSPGIYDLNSGATIVSAEINGVVVKIDIQTDPIVVEAK